jgi:hypothetical protein
MVLGEDVKMYPNVQDIIPWWLKGDPAPEWIRVNEAIYRRFVEVEVQFRIKELDVLQQQIAIQKDKLAALNDVMAK